MAPGKQLCECGCQGRFRAVLILIILSLLGRWPLENRVQAAPRRPPAVARAAKENKSGTSAYSPPNPQFKGKLPITELSEDEAILHALNRLGYGPRPGDVERIRQLGLEKWIDRQLHPDRMDDLAVQARLDKLTALKLGSEALLNQYPQPDVAARRMGITVEEYRKRMDALAHPPQGTRPMPSTLPQEVLNQLQQAKVLRAIYSERQLEEQLSDFWFNHFNVFAYKDLDLWLLVPYERDAIRPHVLGKFRDLLGATAKSPAMLFYLDNTVSADPRAFDRQKSPSARRRQRSQRDLPPLGPKRGLNENYGRELMELHTLGVDGGYTQQDVVEVARAFTGWTIRAPRVKPEFYFDERLHDLDAKRVLGKKIHASGIKDGEQVLDLLVKNQHTAHHLALELAQRFVSDTPPQPLVERMAKAFQKSGGDLREVMSAMIYSPEFWSRDAYRAKVKKPFDLVVSTARALGADVDSAAPLVNWIARIGEPLYQCSPPTGYADRAAAWVNTGALLNRLNFALAMGSNRLPGSRVELTPLLGMDAQSDPYQALDRAVATFLAGQISGTTRSTLERQSPQFRSAGGTFAAPAREVNFGTITGLVLGSPEFQRR